MHVHVLRRLWLVGWITVLLLAAGCFQPAGGGLEATPLSASIPTFTPYPTDIPSPIPLPSDTPTELIAQSIPTLQVFDASTQIAQLPSEQLDPIFGTATAQYLLSQGQQPIQPLDVQPLDVATLDPLLQQATDLVRQATDTAAAPMTMTAQAIYGFPTATPIYILPTYTPVGPVPSGSDCIYEVQPGDPNLYRISLKFGVPYMSIASASHLVNPNLIHVGDRLVIPGCGTTGYVPPPTSTPGVPYPTTNPPSGACPPGRGQYTVVHGDTLFALSLAWGTTVNAIAACNGIPNVNLIYVDQMLYIP